MISFRYHIVSLVAVLLALAAGVVLGSGPLQGDETAPRSSIAGSSVQTTPEDEQALKFNDAYAASLQPDAIKGRLNGRPVTLVLLPGASQPAASALVEAIGQAGGSLAGTVTFGPELVDPAKKQLVDELGGQLEAQATNVTVPTDAGSYERVGTLLGYAIGTKTPAGEAIEAQGKGILTGLSTAGLVSTDENLQKRSSLLVIVAGAPGTDDSAAQGTASIVTSLAKALDAQTGGVVVAGPASASGPTGVLSALRNDTDAAKSVSTVDTADRPAGVTVTVLAMAEQASGHAGAYGGGQGATAPRPGAVVGE